MNDHQIRSAFHQQILRAAHNDPETFVIDELGLKNGDVRADIAVLKSKLLGYEIKTEKDNLNRLPSQIPAYNEVFDHVFLISGEKHLSKVVSQVPDWWGIYVIKPTKNEKFQFHCYRKARINKYKTTFGIAQLLWKDEVKDILLSHYNYKASKKQTKYELYSILSEFCDAKRLGKIVVERLKLRSGWRLNQEQPLKNDDYFQPNSIQ